MGKLGGLLVRPSLKKVKKRINSEQFGGAPLLGVNGRCIIAHGGSSSLAIRNAIHVAEESVVQKVNERILHAIEETKGITPIW